MALIRDIAIGLSVSAGDFNAKLRSADAAVGKFGRSAATAAVQTNRLSFDRATRGIGGIGRVALTASAGLAALGAGVAAHKLSAGIGSAITAASDLNEQLSKSGVVFGPAAAKVEAEARAMGQAFGYPIQQFLDGASSIGLIAKASGLTQSAAGDLSITFAKLAADAASFYNVPVDEALIAIRAGLVGESEPMRRFGVLLSEAAVQSEAVRLGLAKMGAKLTEGQKVQARSSLILRGMTDASGDLARTFNSTANLARAAEGRWTNALADMGAAIQPVTDQIGALRESALKTLTGEIAANREGFKGWASGVSTAGGSVTATLRGVGRAMASVIDIGNALGIGLKGLNLLWANSLVIVRQVEGAIQGVLAALEKWSLGATSQQTKVDVGIAAANVRAAEGFARDMKIQLNEALIAPSAVETFERLFDKIEADAAKMAKNVAGEVKQAVNPPPLPMIEKAKKAAKVPKAREGPMFAGAVLAGSAEAASLQARFTHGTSAKDEPIKEVAKAGKEQVDVSKQILGVLNKIADRAIGKAADAAVELFAL